MIPSSGIDRLISTSISKTSSISHYDTVHVLDPISMECEESLEFIYHTSVSTEFNPHSVRRRPSQTEHTLRRRQEYVLKSRSRSEHANPIAVDLESMNIRMYPSDPSDSNNTNIPDDSLTPIPPPMFLINVNRLSMHSLLDRPLSSNDTDQSDRKSPTTKFPFDLNELIYIDASNIDSGLSSQSSNSMTTNAVGPKSDPPQPPVVTSNRSTVIDTATSPVSNLPPPIPPHAPNSTAARAKQVLNALLTDNCCNASTLSSQSPVSKACRQAENMLSTTSVHLPASPVWKRKRQGSSQAPIPIAHHPVTNQQVNGYLPTLSDKCLCCSVADAYFLTRPSSRLSRSSFIQSSLGQPSPGNCLTCRKHCYAVGVNLFNRNPINGLTYLHKHRFIDHYDSLQVASLIESSPGLTKSRIGHFLGRPCSATSVDGKQLNPTLVMRHLFSQLDLGKLEADEALRLVIYKYGMPVESQEIDRFLHCLSECYHCQRWPVQSPEPISQTQLLLLFYSILLLQTSLYNSTAARSSAAKRTVDSFVDDVTRLLFDASDNDDPVVAQHNPVREIEFSRSKLHAMFDRVKTKPFDFSPDYAALVRRIADSLTFPTPLSMRESKCDFPTNDVSAVNEMYDPHHRLVCYCTVVQFLGRLQTPNKTASLRHLFLFNDLLIIAKDFPNPPRLSKRAKHDLRRHLLTLLRGSGESGEEGQRKRLICSYVKPPLDLISSVNPLPDCHARDANNQERQSRPRSSDTRISFSPPRSSKSPRRGRSLSRSRRYQTRLSVLRYIHLEGCVVRPFRTKDCQYGVEIWKSNLLCAPSSPSVTRQDNQASDNQSSCWRLILTMAALTKSDYINILRDLVACLREATCVQLATSNRCDSSTLPHSNTHPA